MSFPYCVSIANRIVCVKEKERGRAAVCSPPSFNIPPACAPGDVPVARGDAACASGAPALPAVVLRRRASCSSYRCIPLEAPGGVSVPLAQDAKITSVRQGSPACDRAVALLTMVRIHERRPATDMVPCSWMVW